MTETIIFQQTVPPFSKRFWKLFYPYLTAYSILSLVPLFNLNGSKGIIFSFLFINLIIVAVMANRCYKWTLRQITTVILKENAFEIHLLEKDATTTLTINKEVLRTRLKWESSKPRVLVLSIFENDKKIIDVYSGGRVKNEFPLEDIALKIKNCSE